MAIFRSASKSKAPQYTSQTGDHDVKMDSSNIHDPILTAVNEAQPFEEANANFTNNRRPSYLSQDSADLKDIFGQRIRNADMLNPTRNRNERPLDTIRGFEYAITGDLSYREQLESNRLGWGFHEDFPHYSLSGQEETTGPDNQGYSRPVASFGGGDQPIYQAANYSASSLNPDQKKKKKGLFGRKKK
ncbi:CIC11C00000001669 [Sungouiella intermedia]|uniref:CIC11C00000001669 n=1 Tax=Sungouiella intermedia TaxID=45354 RepID=A0A1L0BCC2_9ASCO|nr:CIC11C00000004152 [[Candida] intermedia]SGZ52268.1 CIC11C00000001669 [[Candida] intermedia]